MVTRSGLRSSIELGAKEVDVIVQDPGSRPSNSARGCLSRGALAECIPAVITYPAHSA